MAVTTRTAGRRIRGAKYAGRQAARSGWLALLARTGLAARGVAYILIGAIALEVAFGHSGKQADQSGALRLVASNAIGKILLWVLVVAFARLALRYGRLGELTRSGPARSGAG
jgi:hypothetical protein